MSVIHQGNVWSMASGSMNCRARMLSSMPEFGDLWLKASKSSSTSLTPLRCKEMSSVTRCVQGQQNKRHTHWHFKRRVDGKRAQSNPAPVAAPIELLFARRHSAERRRRGGGGADLRGESVRRAAVADVNLVVFG
jgi:hypothetical protein